MNKPLRTATASSEGSPRNPVLRYLFDSFMSEAFVDAAETETEQEEEGI